MANQNENRELAIKLTDVKKMYKLGQIGGGTLRADLESWWAKKRGLEDPNTKIGEQRLIGSTFMALNGVDLEVYNGEALGIIGGNGAGKSTMLKLLSRVTAPTSGKIQIWGRVASMLEVGTGFNGEMTGRENIYMNGAILGMTKAEIDAKMEDIIEFSEVRDFIDTPVKRYSSGMYVKLAFSVVAHLDSEIMIMDEVLAVGDMAFQKKCLNKMRDAAKKEGRTVLYVSHNMNTIRQLCDRCVVLDKGKVVYSGDVNNAIRVYMGNDDIQLFDIEKERESTDITGIVRIKRVYMIDDNYKRKFGGEIPLFIQFQCTHPLQNLFFRFCIYLEDGTAIATSMGCCENAANGENAIKSTVDISRLAPGKYVLKIIAIEISGMGTQLRHDCINRVMRFEIFSDNQLYNFVWDSKWWGNYVLPDAYVEICKEEAK